MIATRLPCSWRAVRIGEVQPLSAVLPAVLRQYGLQLPLETVPVTDKGSGASCHPDDTLPATYVSGMGFDDSRAAE